MSVGVCAQTFIRSAAFRGAASFQGTANTNAPPAVPDYDGPVWVTNGAITSGTGNITPAIPTGYQENDIFLMFVENCNSNKPVTITGWTYLTNQSSETNFFWSGGIVSSTGLEVWWKRATASESAPTVVDYTDHQISTIMCIRGAETNGSPFDVVQAGVKGVTNVVVSITNGTTTVGNTLIVLAVSDIADNTGTTRWDNWYNASLGGLTERFDAGATAGNGGGIGLATGYLTNAGAFNVTTNLSANSSPNAFWAIAVKKIISDAPAITVQPTSIVAVTNTVETFTVTATGNPAVAYQWNYAGANISGATGASFATNSFPTETAQTNNVFVVVSNSVGSVTSSVVTAAWTNGVPAESGLIVEATNAVVGSSLVTINYLTNVTAGALLVMTVANEAQDSSTTITATSGVTFGRVQDAFATGSGRCAIYTNVFTAGGNVSVTNSWNEGGHCSSTLVAITGQATGPVGFSTNKVSQSAANISFTTTHANSILFSVNSDWNAVSGTMTLRGSGNSLMLDEYQGTFYRGTHWRTTTTTAGAYTMGISAPTGQSAGICIVEIMPP